MPSCDISLLFINLLGKQYQLESQNQQRNNRSQADMHGITDNESESFVITSNGTATTLALCTTQYKEIEKRIQAMTINL